MGLRSTDEVFDRPLAASVLALTPGACNVSIKDGDEAAAEAGIALGIYPAAIDKSVAPRDDDFYRYAMAGG